jgi:probable phosphomutase (TIGR03848 family)
MMTQLLLVRHGHNDWMKDRLAGWTPGVHLNEEGHAAAAALARRLDGYHLDAVFSSPLERARETAAYLAEPRQLEVQELAGVGEVRCGAWTGRQIESLTNDPQWLKLMFYPSGTRLPEGENLAEVQARALAALGDVQSAYPDGVVAVVSHADVIKAVVAHYIGAHLDLFQRLVVAPASLTVVRLNDRGPQLVLFNDTGAVPPPPAPPPVATNQGGETDQS